MTAIPKLVVAMLAAGAMLSTNAQAQPSRPECIAPAKPGAVLT